MLPLHDKITVHYKIDTGTTDSHGNQIYTNVDKTAPATMWPTTVSEASTGGIVTVTRYRVVLDRRETWLDDAAIARDFTVDYGPYSGLVVLGGIERHRVNGRPHHYEFFCKDVAY